MIDKIKFSTGQAVGSAGAATAAGYSPLVRGKVLAAHVAYLGSPPGTTDFTLTDEGDPAGEAILSLSNTATDAKHYPRRQAQDQAGANLSSEYGPYVVHGRLAAIVAQANAGDEVVVTVWMGD